MSTVVQILNGQLHRHVVYVVQQKVPLICSARAGLPGMG